MGETKKMVASRAMEPAVGLWGPGLQWWFLFPKIFNVDHFKIFAEFNALFTSFMFLVFQPWAGNESIPTAWKEES